MKKRSRKEVRDHEEFYHSRMPVASEFKNMILGGQDGLVNVLGVVLAVAAATSETRIVIISGIAANLAESLSMAAVAYTSNKAYFQYYRSQLETEKREIKEVPETEKREIYDIYYKKGFRGKILAGIVKKITSSKKLWLETMMSDELHLAPSSETPLKSAFVVGLSAVVGSTIPLLPFFFLPVFSGIITSLVVSTLVLFITGAVKARYTVGSWLRNGAEMAVIGMVTALAGYGVGALLGSIL